MNEVGCFGKIPAHGDFVWNALPADFVTPWDAWLQQQLIDLRESGAESWLDRYLCSPIWRFVIRDDGFGGAVWCGVIAPSVDTVGRYFPFTLAANLPRQASIVACPTLLESWFASAEECVLGALQDARPLDDVLETLRNTPLPNIGERDPAQSPGDSIWTSVSPAEQHWAERMLEGIVYQSFEQPCFWSTISAEDSAQRVEFADGVQAFRGLFDPPF